MFANKLRLLMALGVLLALAGSLTLLDMNDQQASRPTPQQAPPSATHEPVFDEGWPTLLGPRGDSVSRDRDVVPRWPAAGPPVLWRRSVGTGFSSPVAAGEQLYVFHRREDQEIVEALSCESGESLWQSVAPTAYRCAFAYSHGPYSTPTIDGDRLYAFGAEGVLRCLDIRDGRTLWSRPLHREFDVPEGLFAASSSPLVEGDSVVLNLGAAARSAGVIAVNKQTGETLWHSVQDGRAYATAVAATIHLRRFVFCLTEHFLVALDPRDGRVYWQIPFKSKTADACNATSPLVVDDRVLVSTGPGFGSLCLRVERDGSYRVLWRDQRVLDSTWSNLVQRDGYVYGFSSKRLRSSLRCIELATGRLMWSHESELERGALIATPGHLIAWGETGYLASFALTSEQVQRVSMTREPLLASPCYSAPALHRGRLWLRNEQQLICLDLRGGS